MNKLAVLTFTLLLFLSTMLWYLANGSFNQYLKSQIELQGEYYSAHKTTLTLAEYVKQQKTATFNQLTLANISAEPVRNVLTIDTAEVEVSESPQQNLTTEISKITINKLTINIIKEDDKNNIKELIQKVKFILASDYPQSYPAISAKIYAQAHPELNAEEFAKQNPQVGPIIEQVKQKKSRGKPQPKIIITAINIKTLELNITEKNSTKSIQKHDIQVENIGDTQGIVVNQIGGEILLNLLTLANI